MKKNTLNYHELIPYLFQLQRGGIKWGLDNIRTLCQVLGNPHLKFPAIHIAGTNGKGSTANIIASVLQQAGYKVGLYTSPHLVDFRERIRVNGIGIPQTTVLEVAERLIPTIEKIKPSFFEVTTAMAFHHFAQEKVDIAVVEAGLGGRLDSTNIVNPLLTVITPVDFDHQEYLGDTLEKISGEKAGIIKSGVPCITNNQHPGVLEVLKNVCQKNNSSLINSYDNVQCHVHQFTLKGTFCDLKIGNHQFANIHFPLAGDYQIDNLTLACAVIHELSSQMEISSEAIQRGIQQTCWRGRLEMVSDTPPIIVDVSHNFHGFQRTLQFLHRFYSPEHIKVFTFLQQDKDYKAIARLLKKCAAVYYVQLKAGKPLSAEQFSKAIRSNDGQSEELNSLSDVCSVIEASRDKKTLWLIIGSHYLAGEALQYFSKQSS
ncbi:MAG: bifunctional folylpolyglutamate synthase/dihydrofolate synthase [Calditrichaeota bacterium]|nr:MAG: bifunctional folylpolyglutamate synthase/dihydrofolate synthase [Calditrichota bacterium]